LVSTAKQLPIVQHPAVHRRVACLGHDKASFQGLLGVKGPTGRRSGGDGTLEGQIAFHNGDESGFKAQRA
jgi:hypothetical protein